MVVTTSVSSVSGYTMTNSWSNRSQNQQKQYQRVLHSIPVQSRGTVQSIKEVVGSGFSDSDIFSALKEFNMDADETAHKLLAQDPFHEVKRRRDKRKESMGYRGSVDSQKESGIPGQGMKFRTFPESSAWQVTKNTPQKVSENTARQVHVNTARLGQFHENNARPRGNGRVAAPGIVGTNRQFRVVRDNRVNQNIEKESKLHSWQDSSSTSNKDVVAEKGTSLGPSTEANANSARSTSQASNRPASSQTRHARDHLCVPDRKAAISSSRIPALNNSVDGVYSSSTDPVHVPSPDSRSAVAVGAIKHDVGVVGGRCWSSENGVKESSASGSSFSNVVLIKDGALSESFRPFGLISKTGLVDQNSSSETAMVNAPFSRAFVSNQFNNRQHQEVVGHKRSVHTKEWRPKSSQKSSSTNPGVIGTPLRSTSPPADDKDLGTDSADLQDKISLVNIYENQNVIIAQHIRVPENDRCRLTFGSFILESDSSGDQVAGLQAVGSTEKTALVRVPDDSSGNKQIELVGNQGQTSRPESPASDAVSGNRLREKSSSPQNLDNYAHIGLVQENSSTYGQSDVQQQQDPPELSSFPVYDPQIGYDMSYFKPQIDETVQEQSPPSHQALVPPTAYCPASTVSTVQQQQPPMSQMYQQVHVSHFANLMPYRQYLPPVCVPQMAVPGYSGNPGYPLPSNGSSYFLISGGGSHVRANGLKYGIQQFKPVAGISSSVFGNYSSSGYAINAPGVVGSAIGVEDSSQIKFKDGNLYVPSQQAEASEIWFQNPRELPGLQSAPYYNMPGQMPHAAYLPAHTNHTSFNAAAAQSSHMQFPGLYPPSQPAPMANPHHLGPGMGGNVGIAPTTPGLQVGAYRQPQMGHMNWTTNF